jgi:hypothetical protein
MVDRCERHAASAVGNVAGGCPTVHCNVESKVSFKEGCKVDGDRSDHYCAFLAYILSFKFSVISCSSNFYASQSNELVMPAFTLLRELVNLVPGNTDSGDV